MDRVVPALVGLLLAGSGCGFLLADRCEELCTEVSLALEECMGPSTSWGDLGARSQPQWARECRQDWDRASNDLTSRELELALDECLDTREQLETWSCDEVMALYGPE